jgi:hypothetical protein
MRNKTKATMLTAITIILIYAFIIFSLALEMKELLFASVLYGIGLGYLTNRTAKAIDKLRGTVGGEKMPEPSLTHKETAWKEIKKTKAKPKKSELRTFLNYYTPYKEELGRENKIYNIEREAAISELNELERLAKIGKAAEKLFQKSEVIQENMYTLRQKNFLHIEGLIEWAESEEI